MSISHMNSLYTLALRQTSGLQSDLTALEQSYLSSAGPPSALNGQITASLAALNRTIEDYDSMARREIIEEKKQKAMGRVARFKDDYTSLRKQHEKVKTTGASAKAAADRDALLGGSSSSALSSPYASSSLANRSSVSGPSSNGGGGGGGFAINMTGSGNSSLPTHQQPSASGYRPNSPTQMFDGGGGSGGQGGGYDARTTYALKENDFMGNTAATLDTYIAQGQAMLGNLGTQRDMLKNTKKKILSAANTLGLSRQTIQYIDRRTTGDFYILIGGGAFTLFSFYLILKYFG